MEAFQGSHTTDICGFFQKWDEKVITHNDTFDQHIFDYIFGFKVFQSVAFIRLDRDKFKAKFSFGVPSQSEYGELFVILCLFISSIDSSCRGISFEVDYNFFFDFVRCLVIIWYYQSLFLIFRVSVDFENGLQLWTVMQRRCMGGWRWNAAENILLIVVQADLLLEGFLLNILEVVMLALLITKVFCHFLWSDAFWRYLCSKFREIMRCLYYWIYFRSNLLRDSRIDLVCYISFDKVEASKPVRVIFRLVSISFLWDALGEACIWVDVSKIFVCQLTCVSWVVLEKSDPRFCIFCDA